MACTARRELYIEGISTCEDKEDTIWGFIVILMHAMIDA